MDSRSVMDFLFSPAKICIGVTKEKRISKLILECMFANDCNLCCRRVDLNNYFPFLHGIVHGIRCTFGLTVISANHNICFIYQCEWLGYYGISVMCLFMGLQ